MYPVHRVRQFHRASSHRLREAALKVLARTYESSRAFAVSSRASIRVYVYAPDKRIIPSNVVCITDRVMWHTDMVAFRARARWRSEMVERRVMRWRRVECAVRREGWPPLLPTTSYTYEIIYYLDGELSGAGIESPRPREGAAEGGERRGAAGA